MDWPKSPFNRFNEPALGAFFDTPLALSRWLQRPGTHHCQSHAQSDLFLLLKFPDESWKLATSDVMNKNVSLVQRTGVQNGADSGRHGFGRKPSMDHRTCLLVICCICLTSLAFRANFARTFSVLPDILKKQHRDLMRGRLSSFSSSAVSSWARSGSISCGTI